MGDKSSIEWTEATWNPVVGCSKVSPGCANCYAETLSLRFGWTPKPWLPEYAEENVILKPERLDQPLRWKRPRMIFVNSMSDLFHELIPNEFTFKVLDTIVRSPQHVFQVLTKRPEQAREVMAAYYDQVYWGYPRVGDEWKPLHNLWLGVSIENARYTWRADVLREIPAAVRFISAEPLLGSLLPERCGEPAFPLDGGSYVCGRVKGHAGHHASRYDQGAEWEGGEGTSKLWSNVEDTHWARPLNLTGIDWLIVGGESGGRDSRPMHPQWARELRDACFAFDPDALVERPAFFFKQWGSWTPHIGHIDRSTPNLHVFTARGPEPWYGNVHGSITTWDEPAVGGHGEPIIRYCGVGPKSGGNLLDGREWKEMP